jgi:hypothetical protein
MTQPTGQLVLELLDAHRAPLKEHVDIIVRHRVLSHTMRVKNARSSPAPRVTKLHRAPQGLYSVEIDPPSYRPVTHFVNVAASGETRLQVFFPIDPNKVMRASFPKYTDLPGNFQMVLENSNSVLGFEAITGKSLYDALDDVRRAGMLNIVGKMAVTSLSNGKTVLPYVQKLHELRGDRFFATVPKQLREDVKNSVSEGLFTSEPSGLHHPPSGFNPAGSFKSEDRYGNLQLTFFARGEDEWVADIDIDDAKGLEHVFQVVRNGLTGRPTHPYDIHQILLLHQQVDPGYTLIV